MSVTPNVGDFWSLAFLLIVLVMLKIADKLDGPVAEVLTMSVEGLSLVPQLK